MGRQRDGNNNRKSAELDGLWWTGLRVGSADIIYANNTCYIINNIICFIFIQHA